MPVMPGHIWRARLDELHRLARLANIGFYRWSAGDAADYDVSEEYARLHGMSREAFLAEYQDRDTDIRRWVHPGDVDRYLAHHAEMSRDPRPWRLEYRITLKDGRVRRVIETAEPLLDAAGRLSGWLGCCRDVTEERLKESATRAAVSDSRVIAEFARSEAEKARAQLVEAVESLHEGFVLYDSQDQLVLCNQKYKEFYPRSQDLFQPGVRFEEIIRAGVARGEYTQAVGREEEWIAERLAAHQAADRTLEQLLADGRWLRIEERKTKDGFTVGFRTDITELKAAIEEAEAASRAKSAFLASMSHEIRTPMTGILGMAELLLDRPLGGQEKDMVLKIKGATNSLLGIINDILDLSKIEAGRMEIENGPVDLRGIVGEVADLVKPSIREKGLELKIDISPDLPALVLGDSTRIRQVLVNLAGNAAKFTVIGGVSITIAWAGDEASIAVADTGIGIGEKDVPRLFQEFEQADNSTTQLYQGTGLGLAICKRLTEMMGGRIAVRSTLGEGSTFTVTLPAKPAEAPAEPVTESVTAPQKAAPARPLHILVVDDNDLNRILIKALLKKVGFTSDEAVDGRDAVEKARGGAYDLILMDIRMPEMSGPEATRMIRSLPGDIAGKPIVALTADVVGDQVEEYAAAGMNRTVAKPIQPQELYQTIRELTAG